MIALAVVLALLGLVIALGALSWFLGWGLASALRASLSEAGERTSEAVLEFWDWVRLGR